MIDEDEAAVRLASERLDSGMVGLNSSLYSEPPEPFGGTDQSGLGREGGHDGMLDHLESTDVAVQW
jgi:succinate-semialdehyde dehydrogenase / glutarate-semialdehyde dehydrogenase